MPRMRFIGGMNKVMKVILALFLVLFSYSAQAVVRTIPAQPGIAPRANAAGMGYSPPSNMNNRQIVPKQNPPYQGPTQVYNENGRPTTGTTNATPAQQVAPLQTAPAPKVCRDSVGNVKTCPNIRPTSRIVKVPATQQR